MAVRRLASTSAVRASASSQALRARSSSSQRAPFAWVRPRNTGRATSSCIAHASYIAADTWKRFRACTVGRAKSSRIACSSTSFHRRATDGAGASTGAADCPRAAVGASADVRDAVTAVSATTAARAPRRTPVGARSRARSDVRRTPDGVILPVLADAIPATRPVCTASFSQARLHRVRRHDRSPDLASQPTRAAAGDGARRAIAMNSVMRAAQTGASTSAVKAAPWGSDTAPRRSAPR